MQTALGARGVSKTFPGQRALDDVDIDVVAGEIHALVGQNGSGKSTLVKILAGYHEPDAGAVAHVRGRPFELGSAAAARAAGLRFVHQDLGLVEVMSVTDNFFLSAPDRSSLSRVRRRDERATVRAALAALGYDLDPDALVVQLAESERTAVAMARALADIDEDPVLLVLDEVTASLPGAEVDRLFDALRRIAASGVAILFISHHLDEVLGLADRVTVLRDGRRIATARTADMSHDDLFRVLVGRELEASLAHASAAVDSHEDALRVRGLGGATIADLDLSVRRGEVVGVAGLTGSGREELAGLIAGRLPRTGTVEVGGVVVAPMDPHAAIHAGVCLVPADRAAHALLPATSMRENMTIPDLRPFWRRGRLCRSPERAEVERWIGALDVRPVDGEASVGVLSGGNQQKVVMARWLRVRPTVLVLDEPTQGVDVGSKSDIHRLIDGAAADGAAVLVCSTDSDELVRLADRVLILHRGRVTAELEGEGLTVEQIEQRQLSSAGRPFAAPTDSRPVLLATSSASSDPGGAP